MMASQYYKTTAADVIDTITQKQQKISEAAQRAIEFAKNVHPEAVAIGGIRFGTFVVSSISLPRGVDFTDLPADKGKWKKNGTPYKSDKETTKAFNALTVRFGRARGVPESVVGNEDHLGRCAIYFLQGEVVDGLAILNARVSTDKVTEPWEPITAAEYYTIKGE